MKQMRFNRLVFHCSLFYMQTVYSLIRCINKLNCLNLEIISSYINEIKSLCGNMKKFFIQISYKQTGKMNWNEKMMSTDIYQVFKRIFV